MVLCIYDHVEGLLIKADNSFLSWKNMLVRLTMSHETYL